MNRQFDRNTTNMEVFAVKETFDGRKAFIGYTAENGNFEYFDVPFTQPVESANFYKKVAEKLWQLLDDIDTASDIFKPCENNGFESYEKYYKYCNRKTSQRFDYLKSDGYDLFTPEEFIQLNKNYMDHYINKSSPPDIIEFGSKEYYEAKEQEYNRITNQNLNDQ